MKKIILLMLLSTLCLNLFSQGWLGNSSSNSLYSINDSLKVSPIKVGIGTSKPTEQLHTTGGVKFQGIRESKTLSRVLVQGTDGKLHWREASTFMTSPHQHFWSLTGNAATNPGTGLHQDYLGTSDSQKLVIATNAVERMSILPNGRIGIGNANSTADFLTVGNGSPAIGAQGSQLYTFHVLGKGANAVEHLGMFNNDKATTRSELTVSNSGNGRWEDNFVAIMVHSSKFSYQNSNNYYLNQDNSGYALINAQSNALANVPLKKFSIGVFTPGIPLSFYTSNKERLFINDKGQTGIATTAPTAALHVKCDGIPVKAISNIRFENLQAGTGKYLVIDANGYVTRSDANPQTCISQEQLESVKAELLKTKQELYNLMLQLIAMMEAQNLKVSTPGNNDKNLLEIIPTPFNEQAKAVYSIEKFQKNAFLQAIDANGTILKTFPLNQSQGQVELGEIRKNSGTIIFTIVADGKSIISKKSLKL